MPMKSRCVITKSSGRSAIVGCLQFVDSKHLCSTVRSFNGGKDSAQATVLSGIATPLKNGAGSHQEAPK